MMVDPGGKSCQPFPGLRGKLALVDLSWIADSLEDIVYRGPAVSPCLSVLIVAQGVPEHLLLLNMYII
jgi:hypothetical protein